MGAGAVTIATEAMKWSPLQTVGPNKSRAASSTHAKSSMKLDWIAHLEKVIYFLDFDSAMALVLTSKHLASCFDKLSPIAVGSIFGKEIQSRLSKHDQITVGENRLSKSVLFSPLFEWSHVCDIVFGVLHSRVALSSQTASAMTIELLLELMRNAQLGRVNAKVSSLCKQPHLLAFTAMCVAIKIEVCKIIRTDCCVRYIAYPN
jgi:hypothetical protein